MKLGLQISNFTWGLPPAEIGPRLGEIARAAEEAGYDSIWVMDHLFQIAVVGPVENEMFEAYTLLGYLAGLTKRARLGTMVTGVTYRHPGLLAKIVTTLDVLSGGRAMLGIGAAWYEREHRGLGVPFPPLRERFERLEEALQICQQMWSDNDGPYTGKHYQLAETICEPKPVSQPRPRIMIGGSGERKTLRLVARYADACNIFDIGLEGVKHKLDVLAAHCEAEGRDPATIQKTMLLRRDPIGNPEGFLADAAAYKAIGIDMVQVAPTGPDPATFVAQLREKVGPGLAQI